MSHEYHAKVIRWIDGDTVILDIDLGFHVRITEHIRLTAYDAPEAGQPGYTEAKTRAEQLCPIGATVFVRTHKSHARSFTRWLGDIHPTPTTESVSATLTNEGLTKAGWANG